MAVQWASGGEMNGLAVRAAADPSFLAYPLGRYQAANRLDDDALAAQLGITPSALAAFRLCTRPWHDPHAVALSALAARFGVDVAALGRMLGIG